MGQSALALTIKITSINIALTAFVAVVRRLLLRHFGVILIGLSQYLWLNKAIMRKRSQLLITKLKFIHNPLRSITVHDCRPCFCGGLDVYFYVVSFGLLLDQLAWLVFIDWKIHEKYCHYWRDFKWSILPAIYSSDVGNSRGGGSDGIVDGVEGGNGSFVPLWKLQNLTVLEP